MDTKYLEDYLQQLSEWQKKFFDTWVQNLPDLKNGLKMPESLEKGVDVQEQLVKNYLEAQETSTKLALETQKKFWESYFEMARKSPVLKTNG
ncbi:MAG TPA: thylakoid-associated protein [Allocoleopsis sp.]